MRHPLARCTLMRHLLPKPVCRLPVCRLPACVPLCLLIAAGASACKSYAPVGSFAVQTQAVTTAFDPMLAQAMHSCRNSIARTGIIADRPFQPQAAAQDAQRRCQPYAMALAAMAELNQVLQRYADVLSALASKDLSRHADEFGALGGALAKLPQASGEGALLDAGKVEKVLRLSELIARVASERRQQAGIAALLEREDDIRLISDTLRSYAEQHYRNTLNDETRTLATLERALDNAGAREPLASNYLRARIELDRQQLAGRGRQVAAYAAAIEAMQRSLGALRRLPMDDPQLARQLEDFAGSVSALQRQAPPGMPTPW